MGLFFSGVIVSLENTYVYWLSLVIWSVFLFFVWLGQKRCLLLNETGIAIQAILKTNRRFIPYQKIKEIQLGKNGILIISTEKKEYYFLLLKKTSQRFLKEQKENSALKDKLKTVNKIDVNLS